MVTARVVPGSIPSVDFFQTFILHESDHSKNNHILYFSCTIEYSHSLGIHMQYDYEIPVFDSFRT